MTIEEIYYTEDLSVRSLNVCNHNDLRDLSAILKHFRGYGTFGNLKNCGRKSNKELTTLCLKYNDFENNSIIENIKPEKQLISTITNFGRTQREIVNSFIEINANNLSNRSKNAITSFLNGNLKIRNISEKILINDRFNFQIIKNVGTKTVTELKIFIDSIIKFIEKVAQVENETDLVALRNRFFIEKTFPISSIPIEILESQSIFSVVNFLISKDALFEKNENVIFQKALKIYDNQPELTLDEIADEINISRERVRQIRKGILENLFNKLQFLRKIEDDLYQKYGIDQNQSLIDIDNNLNKQINEVNNTNFSTEFITFIIYAYISDKFGLIGDIADVLLPNTFNSRERHNWNHFYLVAHDLINQIDYNKFAKDIGKRIDSRNEETYSLHFKSYLNNFLKIEGNYILELAFPTAEKIINQEFDVLLDLNDNIVFKRNTVKQVPEFAIEALEKLGAPSKIDEIYELIEKDYPGTTKSKNALRGSLKRTSGIIYFGRSSTYGLKKWETENEGIKGGTIKEIIFDFINGKKYPLHISSIMDHLRKYRGDKNEKSIINNLKSDPHNRFIVFSQNFIGLRKNIKFYNEKYNKLPIHLSKSIIAKHLKGESKSEINNFLQENFYLTFDESNLIINYLKYFNEN